VLSRQEARTHQGGFTITEALVSSTILVLIMIAVYLVLDTSRSLYWRAEASADIQQEVRFGLERMRREISMAGYDPSGTGQASLQNLTSASLEFIADVDGNNVSDLVKYDRDSSTKTIRRTVRGWTGSAWGAASATTVAQYVDTLSFQYSPSAAIPGLKRIRVSVTASEQKPNIPNMQHQVATEIFLRNL
jgi:Tfp pilus assembly protein PilW